MSTLLNKKRIKREVKNNVKNSVIEKVQDNLREVKDILLSSFSVIEDIAISGESIIDFLPFKEIFNERVMGFEYIPESENGLKIRVPNIDNFDFSGIEFIEFLCEGVVGEIAEATSEDVYRLFGRVSDFVPINEGLSDNLIYILQVDDNLVDRERSMLGYSINRSPFSDTEPLGDLIFGPAEEFVSNNIENWISSSIDSTLSKVISSYGGTNAKTS